MGATLKVFDVAVDGFHHSETCFGTAIVEDAVEVDPATCKRAVEA
jgi:hypothetical protein